MLVEISGKPKFSYCNQTKEYAGVELENASQKLLINSSASKAIAIGENPLPDQNGQLELSSNQQSKGGRRLVWFRTLAFQASDPGFKSRRPHHPFGYDALSQPFKFPEHASSMSLYGYEQRLRRCQRSIKQLRNGETALRFLTQLAALGLSIGRVTKACATVLAVKQLVRNRTVISKRV
jgi:hypothetical protein